MTYEEASFSDMREKRKYYFHRQEDAADGGVFFIWYRIK
jgi:hypothetical protein